METAAETAVETAASVCPGAVRCLRPAVKHLSELLVMEGRV